MKKLILTIAIFATLTIPALSQEKAFVPATFGDNWFIQLQGGVSYTISENYKDASFGDLVSPHAAISLGKYFSPKVGARLNVGGWESKNYYKIDNVDGTYKIRYIQTSVDGLLNLTNLFMPYKEDRGFNFIAFAGIGYAHGFKNKDRGISRTNTIVPRVGLQADFRLNDAMNFNIEVAGNLLADNFNGRQEGKKYDGMIDAMVGLSFNLGKSGFEMVDVVDPAEVDRLNSQLNNQRALLTNKDAEINRLKTELAKKPEPQIIVQETKEVKEETEVLMNAVVVFRIGSAKLEQNQDINIFNAARYLKDNPKVNVIVTGYADKSTGTAAVNQRLSEQRAQAVANVLITKYDIAASRITTKASGDKEQLFPTDQWNRVVVFTATTK
ncbi:OmpA family protein [Prevotella sp. 10(H)]|uniref:OmpA family protein n=1 Tax=Prevotella sp. 10(H) TaxID=1158294 RepID=UPI00068FDBDE|nr:OmpA family protein [Prevotella sp. 10(H)]